MINAFQQMWGSYPGPVMLLNSRHVILSVNRAYGQTISFFQVL